MVFFSVLLLHSGHTSKLQFFHCFSIVSRVLYAIMVPHRSLNFTWQIKTAIFPLLFHCFTRALRDNGPTSEPQFYLASFYPLPILSTVFPRVFVRSIHPSISSIFPVFCHVLPWFYSISPVCLTLAQMHLPQSLQLHRINGFARFLHGFFSVLLLHSGHISKLQFFHCFSIVSRVLYAIMVPHRSHFTLSLFFPPFLLAF